MSFFLGELEKLEATTKHDDLVDAWVKNLDPWAAQRVDIPFSTSCKFNSATGEIANYDNYLKPAMTIWLFQDMTSEDAESSVKAFATKISECNYNFGILPISQKPLRLMGKDERDDFLNRRGKIANVIVTQGMTILDAANAHADRLRNEEFNSEFYLKKILGIIKTFARRVVEDGHQTAAIDGKLRCKFMPPATVQKADEPMHGSQK